jgi:hypothetical protein
VRVLKVRLSWIQKLPGNRGGGLLQWFDVHYKREGVRVRFLMSLSCPVGLIGVCDEKIS